MNKNDYDKMIGDINAMIDLISCDVNTDLTNVNESIKQCRSNLQVLLDEARTSDNFDKQVERIQKKVALFARIKGLVNTANEKKGGIKK